VYAGMCTKVTSTGCMALVAVVPCLLFRVHSEDSAEWTPCSTPMYQTQLCTGNCLSNILCWSPKPVTALVIASAEATDIGPSRLCFTEVAERFAVCLPPKRTSADSRKGFIRGTIAA
jgi:hypothetical protein